MALRRLFLPVLAAALAAAPAAGPGRAAELDARERADLARVEAYLDGIGTLRARFAQRASTGETASGVLHLARPGRMRFEYDPPSPILLVASGGFLVFVDNELEQVTHIPLGSTPLAALVGGEADLAEDHDVLAVERGEGALTVVLAMKDDPQAGSARLLFSDRPLALRRWTVRDAQGIEVQVTLLEVERGMALDPELFRVPASLYRHEEQGR